MGVILTRVGTGHQCWRLCFSFCSRAICALTVRVLLAGGRAALTSAPDSWARGRPSASAGTCSCPCP
eukprot:1004224-Heterocapsa_arctica.AAC.1